MNEHEATARLYEEMKGNAVIMLRHALANRYSETIEFVNYLDVNESRGAACALAGILADFAEVIFDFDHEEIDRYLTDYLTTPYPDDTLES